jgi:hypothetical protein
VSLISTKIAGERPFGAIGEIGFAVESNEVGQTVVEGVPEIANTSRLITGVPETILVGSEVPTRN